MTMIFMAAFPFFAIIFCGYGATRFKLLPVEAIPGLNVFLLYFALPCMLFRFGASTPIEKLLDSAVFFTWCTGALLLVAITVCTTRRGAVGWNDASFGALVAAFPNTGFMGMPLLLSLGGQKVAGPVIISLSIDMVVTSSLCIALSRLSVERGEGTFHAAKNALKGTIVNPLPWAIVLGGVASYMHVKVVAPIMTVVDMLAHTASPMGLFSIGAVLARAGMIAGAPTRPCLPSDAALITFYKLALHPMLIFGIGYLASRAGLPLDWFSLSVLVAVAALPSASNVAILAERFGASAERIAYIVLISTALSFFTLSFVLSLFFRKTI